MSPRFVSLHDEIHDAVILGAGFAGFAAARELAVPGQKILLLEPSGQLLWESTQALHNQAANPEKDPAWAQWIAMLRERKAANEEYFDVAAAEIAAAEFLTLGQPDLRTLLYATPVAAHSHDGRLRAITVATKAGFRTLRARNWVDASENGLLAALVSPENRSHRRKADQTHALSLQSLCWEKYEDRLRKFCLDTGIEVGGSFRANERGIRWREDGQAWHRSVVEMLGRLRQNLSAGPDLIVSQLSSRAYPSYEESGTALVVPENLLVLSPMLCAGSFASPASRFAWGSVATQAWLAGWRDVPDGDFPEPPPPEPDRVLKAQVAVVGTGTSGALAALAAGRQGSDVLALEFASFPGGVGTGAGISGYFHGVEGGLQVETDRLTAQMDLLLQGHSPSARKWHYESKKLAILSAFEDRKVRFLGGLLICAVEKAGANQLSAILAASDDGILRVEAPVFVDSTGDGDLCTLAGNEFQTGRSGDGRTLAYSQPAMVIKEIEGMLEIGTENFDAGWVDPTDPEDLSRARLDGVVHYLTAKSEPFAIAPLPGIRQSRQIRTDYELKFSDLIEHRHFSDSIGQAGSIADTHSIDYEFEDDEAVFFFLVCRLFRYPLRAELPYRMLLPDSLDNVWIACRAAGMENNASYAIRMQRDMQRLGEAAGSAAALAASNGGRSRAVKMDVLQAVLNEKDALPRNQPGAFGSPDEARRLLEEGVPGIHLWQIFQNREEFFAPVCATLQNPSPLASFYAAALLAMWKDPAAEPRLIRAIKDHEPGLPPSKNNTGAHGQEIDIPFWLLAVILLRRCGTSLCLESLEELAGDASSILNVRTTLAMTLDRLSADRRIPVERAEKLTTMLVNNPLAERFLAPSRSTWRSLRSEEQLILRNNSGIEVREDHSWQLHLILCRIRSRHGQSIDDLVRRFDRDPRAIVRRAFAEFAQ